MNDSLTLAIVCRELQSLGKYWRSDWSDFDGRTLKNQLDSLVCWAENHHLGNPPNNDFTEFSDMRKEQLDSFN